MSSATQTKTQTVECPQCGATVSVDVPAADATVRTSLYVAAFGDSVDVTCADDHRFWVYYC
ncbi:hypothetical protein [Halopiger thermotolerans]